MAIRQLTDEDRVYLNDEQWALEYQPLQGDRRTVRGSELDMVNLRRELRESGVTQIRFFKAGRLDKQASFKFGGPELGIHPHRISKAPGTRAAESVAREYAIWARENGLDRIHVFPIPKLKNGKPNKLSATYRAREFARRAGGYREDMLIEVDTADYIYDKKEIKC